MRKSFLLFTFLIGCCPTIVGPPGDDGAQNWKPSNKAQPERTYIDCHDTVRSSLSIRKSNVTVRNCKVEGDIRIWGPAMNANSESLKRLSRKKDYVSILRAQAPTGVIIENCSIKASGRIPLYIGPGVTFTTIRNVHIYGQSDSTMVYLGAETHGTIIEGSTIDSTDGNREAIAIDSSDHNRISGNTIKHSDGGIYLYRNCGEKGTIRHTTSSYNEISKNNFVGGDMAIWVGSREGNRCYCQDDKGYPYGSSISDMDHARQNIVQGNNLGDGKIKVGKYSSYIKK
jgi:parallel beta-helix repeat protein